MRLGLLTACLPGEPLEEIAAWAGDARLPGARGRGLARPSRAGTGRRATSTSSRSTRRRRPGVRSLFDVHGLEVSAVAYYENNLHHDPATREATHDHLRRCIDAAQLLGVRPRRAPSSGAT